MIKVNGFSPLAQLMLSSVLNRFAKRQVSFAIRDLPRGQKTPKWVALTNEIGKGLNARPSEEKERDPG